MRSRLAGLILLVLLATCVAGCVRPPMQKWGSDITVDWDQGVHFGVIIDDGREYGKVEVLGTQNPVPDTGSVVINSEYYSDTIGGRLYAGGCLDDRATNDTSDDVAQKVILDGWLSAVKHFDKGPKVTQDVGHAAPTSILIDASGSFDAAEQREIDNVGKVGVKGWTSPTAAEVTISGDDDGWGYLSIAALIPASEHVYDGFRALTWHQAVEIQGYVLVRDKNPSDSGHGTVVLEGSKYYQCAGNMGGDKLQEEERLPRSEKDGSSKTLKSSLVILVTDIKTGRGDLSTMAEDSGEFSPGSVGGTSASAYLLFVAIVAGGGGFGAFVLSRLLLERQVQAMTNEMIQADKLEAASGIKSAMKQARKEGRDPEKEDKERERARQAAIKKAERAEKERSSSPDSPSSSFSIDSILGGSDSADTSPSSGPGVHMAGGGGVVTTD
ncbi:MAG TPA: hypothetical protein QF646_03735, partial [Candidatus Poseidoniales archaeon]|nr:hypothetical protein [Candidatus Poseidoniales archaeon]